VVAWLTIGREKPDMIASAGGYTAVPVVICGSLKGVPSWIHQQDARVVLTNRLCAPFAKCVTVAWEHLVRSFPAGKTKWIGNPARPSVLAGKRDLAFERFGIDLRRPTVLVFGGGGGATWINHMMEDVGGAVAERANVIHITGRGKMTERLKRFGKQYHAVEFLTDDMAHALASATIVVARAGMGTITELAALKKPSILIPIPHSMQEDNAKRLAEANAAVILRQLQVGVGDFKLAVLNLLGDKKRQTDLGERLGAILPTEVAEKFARHARRHCLER